MRIDVFTIFPGLINDFCNESLLGRGQQNSLLDIRAHDLRDGATDRHRTVDDAPYGGGAGMLLSAEPIFNIVEKVSPPRPLFLLSPGGKRFDQAMANSLAETEGFSLLCGRYEGVDQRVADHLCDGEISIGDYVLAGGEVAALVIVEAVSRLVPGVMGNSDSFRDESFSEGVNLVEYPQYTRPQSINGFDVPEVLLSGNHQAIREWRLAQAKVRTERNRPDLTKG